MTESAQLSGSISRREQILGRLRPAVRDELHGPLPAMLLALTVLAGVVDAVSILRLGHVFVATVTGNLVFLGLAAAGAGGFAVGTSALAIGAFFVGVMIGARACELHRWHRGLALRNVLRVKLLLASAVTVVSILAGPDFSVTARDTMIVLIAVSMGAQLAAIRFLKVPDLLTVVMTMTVIGVLTERRWDDPATVRRILSVVAFVFGALSGALLILYVGVSVALSFGLGIIVAVAIAAHWVSRTQTDWSAPR